MASDWETGQRRPPAWRVPLLVLVALAVAGPPAAPGAARARGGMTVTTGEQVLAAEPPALDVVGGEPTDAGGRWLCPQDLPVRAYGDGLAYPGQHPQRPASTVEPATCYRDIDAAEAGGYALAPPPPDTAVVYGLYLQEPPESTLRDCAQAARTLGFAVPCPGQLPHPAEGASCAGSDGSCVWANGFVIELRDFPVPVGWCDDCDARVTITAVRRDVPHAAFATCAGEDLPARLPSRPGRRFESCPTGPPWIPGNGGYPHEGNTLVRWARDGVVYGVSVEGDGPAQYALVSRVANSILLVAGVDGDRSGARDD